jgi:hypothetical protein
MRTPDRMESLPAEIATAISRMEDDRQQLRQALSAFEAEFGASRVNADTASLSFACRLTARLAASNASRVLDVEISFRDQVYGFQELNLTGTGVAIRAFTVHEIIAETKSVHSAPQHFAGRRSCGSAIRDPRL